MALQIHEKDKNSSAVQQFSSSAVQQFSSSAVQQFSSSAVLGNLRSKFSKTLSILATATLLASPAVFANTNQISNPLSKSDEHGCRAYLCFAGGMAFSECQPTITKVKRDLARGKSFPSCSFLSNDDGSVGGQNGSPKIWTERTKKRVYVKIKQPDGTIQQLSSIKRK